MESTMKLYGFPLSPNTWKVRALAAHIGVPLELSIVDMKNGQHRSPDYLALNPTGRVPVLVDGDFALWESVAIMQYIASKKPNPLWPDDVRARADITRWQSWQVAHWGKEACEPLLYERFIKKTFNLGPMDQARVAAGTEAFNREAAMLDAHLAKQPFVAASGLSLADFSIAAALIYATQGEFPLAPYAHVRAWFDRVFALPAWKETAPPPLPVAA
jgi:glutathione S-transferase